MESSEIPEEGSAERTRLAASAMHRRERQVFGGAIQWEAAFFGWLAAIGLAAILVAMVVGAGAAVGVTEIDDDPGEQAERLNAGGGALLVAILGLPYLAGGYVAGRMARFDGWRQGLGVWVLALVMTLALALTAWLAGGDVNPLESLELPRVPVEEGGLTRGGAIVTALGVLVTLAAAIGGGVAGERFHRAVDEAGIDLGTDETREVPEEQGPEQEDEGAADEREDADAAAESEGAERRPFEV